MNHFKQHKLSAATMLEVVTEMVIIMIIFAVSMVMFVRITGAGITLEKTNASLLLNKSAFETKQEQSFSDDESKIGELIIKKTIEPYGANPALILLKLEAKTNDGKLIATRKELILIEKQ